VSARLALLASEPRPAALVTSKRCGILDIARSHVEGLPSAGLHDGEVTQSVF